jgi:hypothetical protein
LANKIISKHQINLQLNPEELLELKSSSAVESPTPVDKQAPTENLCQPASTVNMPKDQQQSGNFINLN